MAKLAQAVAARPEYMKLAGTAKASVRTADGKREFPIANTNALIGYTGVLGLKTGYTPEAGTCIVALAERDGVRVLLVLLKGPERWWDAAAMLERAFAWR
jgi:D-alanyl-D-alanine carboxypeptidase (penicillin-binding protein 5/6)